MNIFSNFLYERDPKFIVNRWVDYVFFIFTPWLAYLLAGTAFFLGLDEWLEGRGIPVGENGEIAGQVFIAAHLFAVVFRSHGNKEIFQQYPLRFTLAPILLFLAMATNLWVLVIVSVIATWWDVYHSSLQTFGLGRIYDAKLGNSPIIGRRMDQVFNLYLYLGPILAGASLMDHVNDFQEFGKVGSIFFTSLPKHIEDRYLWLRYVVIGTGIPFLIFYYFYYKKLVRQGYQVSLNKIQMLVVTGSTSIFSWGFNTFGEAFVIMNLFHALQYFAIVWFYEGKRIQALFRLDRLPWGSVMSFVGFLGIIFSYGVFDAYTTTKSQAIWAVSLTVSIMHFWYDGFIWSVRKKQV